MILSEILYLENLNLSIHYFPTVGYCAIDYSESATTTPDPFALGAVITASVVRSLN